MHESFERGPVRHSSTSTIKLEQDLAQLATVLKSERFAEGERSLRESIDREIEHFVHDLMAASLEAGFRVSPASPPWSSKTQEDTLVRNENPERIIEALFDGTPISISAKPEGNACLASRDGIDAAFAWGHHNKGVRMVYGFSRDAVKESPIVRQEDDLREVPDAVAIEGSVPADAIRFVLLRVPASGFPKDLLTDTEVEDERDVIYRAITPQKPEEKKTAPH